MIQGYAATSPESGYELIEYELGELLPDQVDIQVEFCGICHSDLSMKKNDWEMTTYPFVGGHEVAGRVAAVGSDVQHLEIGQRVGLGWTARSCMTCDQCMSGYQNRCAESMGTIVGRHGGFSNQVRAQGHWAIPIPEGVESVDCGPLFCGGLTVFTPFVENQISPVAHVGIVGIGGLGHMALGFAKAWGCEVTAFSTTPEKEAEARGMGAHHFLNSRDDQQLAEAAGRFDMILVTVNAPLNWDAYVAMLKPGGKLHLVGAAAQITTTIFPLIVAERSIGGSPTGGIQHARQMLEFCRRHQIQPTIETFPMSQIEEAMAHLESGKARYRIVLEADF